MSTSQLSNAFSVTKKPATLRPHSLKGLILPVSVIAGYGLHQLIRYLKQLPSPEQRQDSSSMAPDNKASYLCASCQPLEIRNAPYVRPGDNEIVIRNYAVAINPVNWVKQHAGDGFAPWVKYPFIMGSDVAGEVVEVGSKVTQFGVGDRVLGHAVGMSQRVNRSEEGAFQLYTVLRSNLASRIPDSLPFERACILPLGLSTAAWSLFSPDHLALQRPTVEKIGSNPSQTVVIWGGSSSVGCNAIQLATAAGLNVITTASPHNHVLMKKLGASVAFDYSSPSVVEDLKASINASETDLAGILAIGGGSLGDCVDLMLSLSDDNNSPRNHRKFICQFSSDLPKAGFRRGSTEWPTIDGVAMSSTERARAAGISVKFVIGSDIMDDMATSKAIYNDYIPQAMAAGIFMPEPEPLIVGKGLEHVQEAMNTNRKGVSARKVVVCL